MRQQRLNEGVDRHRAGFHHQVRYFLIEGFPQGHQVPQRAAGVRGGQQGAVPVAASSAEQFVHAGSQIHDNAPFVQPLTIFGRQDRAATRGKNNVAPLGTLFQSGGLPATKTGFALDFEDYRHPHAATRLELMIQIHKLAPQRTRQTTAYGRLAGSHHPNQEDGQVVRQRHGFACALQGARQVFMRLVGGRWVRVSLRT